MSESSTVRTISKELRSAFRGYMWSPIFELVAKDDVTFYVHKDILGHHSQPFKDATSGTWKESHERKILLPDWDADTVGHLVQFLYTGDYTYPSPATSDRPPHTPVNGEESVPNSPSSSRSGAMTPFPESVHDASHEHASPPMTDSAWLERVDTTTFDFEETFLTHAAVYALAHYKSIPALKVLAHGRLSRTLSKLHPFKHNPHLATNIIRLAAYVYANTDSLTSSEEPLRSIVSRYVALNFVAWQAEPAAVELMCTGGDFVKDVLAKICRQLAGDGLGSGLASPGTRYVTGFRAVTQRFSPPEYIREHDNLTGKAKYANPMSWLVPDYTTDYTQAATHFYFSRTVGIPIGTITGRTCGSPCRIHVSASGDSTSRIVEVLLVRCRDSFIEMNIFPGFHGIVSHTAHAEGHDSLHILWRSMRAV